MPFDEGVDYDPAVIEKYIVSNMEFFKRWSLNNITLNQLNGILIEHQMMPTPAHPSYQSRFSSITEEVKTGESDTTTMEDVSPTVRLLFELLCGLFRFLI